MKTIAATFLLILFASCHNNSSTSQTKQEITNAIVKELATIEAQSPDSILLETSLKVLEAIKKEDYEKLTFYIHPTKGIRFSPYAYVDTTEDVVIKQTSFTTSFSDNYFWGSYDGSGESINLTTKDYFKQFVYNADFLHAEKVGINKMIGVGNSLNNLTEVYPNSVYTEHHFSGFNPAYEGMDWTSLRLVYEKLDGELFLVGIIHDQWTI
ncbi:MAG TPA: hypothetical protein EYG86_07080 [Crocinitomicaceae bacterium]|nr:hypothetical protein [Crocinitomicaceae bacterium]